VVSFGLRGGGFAPRQLDRQMLLERSNVGSGYDSSLITVNFVLARFNPNGSFDSTFGNNGTVFTDINTR